MTIGEKAATYFAIISVILLALNIAVSVFAGTVTTLKDDMLKNFGVTYESERDIALLENFCKIRQKFGTYKDFSEYRDCVNYHRNLDEVYKK